MHGSSLNSLLRFSENFKKSSYKIENSGNLRTLSADFFLPTISYKFGAMNPSSSLKSLELKGIFLLG